MTADYAAIARADMKAADPKDKPPEKPIPSYWLCPCGYMTGVHRPFCCHCGERKK